MRFTKVFVVVCALAAVFASNALAGGYTDPSYLTPIGKVGTPYSHTIAWKPGTGCPPYGYHLDPGNYLPPGLSLNVSSGVISGTPTQAGTFTFYVSQIDQCGNEGQGNSPFKITIQPGPPPVPLLTITSSNVPVAEAGLSYSVTLAATGGSTTAAKSWKVSAGQLAPGLTLSSGGAITGTPSGAGSFSFTAFVSDGTSSASRTFTLTVIPGITVDAAPHVPEAEVRTPFTFAVASILGTSGGASPYHYAPVSGFPFGIGFDTNAGTIFGSPRTDGTLNLTISITDANHATKQVTLPLVVLPRLHIVPLGLHRAHAGKAYRAKIAVTGGKDPSWSISAGSLPAGLKLNAATGLIKGIAHRKGTYSFSVKVHDALGAAVAIRYTLVVGT